MKNNNEQREKRCKKILVTSSIELLHTKGATICFFLCIMNWRLTQIYVWVLLECLMLASPRLFSLILLPYSSLSLFFAECLFKNCSVALHIFLFHLKSCMHTWKAVSPHSSTLFLFKCRTVNSSSQMRFLKWN